MKRGTWKKGGMVCLWLLIMAAQGAYAGFNFIRPAIMLTDGGSLSYSEVNIDFDNDNALHAVWLDDISGYKQIFGTSVLRDGTVLGKFPAMISTPSQNYGLPHIFRNAADTSKMYEFAINRNIIEPDSLLEAAYWDLTLLPAAPGVIPFGSINLNTANTVGGSHFDMVSAGSLIVYAVTVSPAIHIRPYNVSGGYWDSETIISPEANHVLSYPRLSKDETGCIYLSYNSQHITFLDNELYVMRTSLPNQTVLWLPAVSVAASPDSMFRAELTVEGLSVDQKTALVYTTGPSPIEIVANVAMGNMWPSEGVWPGVPVVAAAIPGSVTMFLGPDAAYSPGGSRLYITWADDRELSNSELYGIISYDGGLSFGSTETLTDLNMYIMEPPSIISGTELGNLAVGFILSDGDGSNPYALVSQSDFLDACDDSPALFWDGYAGVTVDSGTYLSFPACYRMASESLKGTLLQDYGTLEQTGYISLYFYDDPAITGTDFLVGMENANSKGVIRMLGVRNDTTQENYSYNSNGTWLDSGIPRQLGWHQIVMSVEATTGLIMSLEYAPGSTASWSDGTFTSFTSVSIDGGSDTDPYYVDDIQLLAVPIPGNPLPATTWFGLAIGLSMTGLLIVRSRRSTRLNPRVSCSE